MITRAAVIVGIAPGAARARVDQWTNGGIDEPAAHASGDQPGDETEQVYQDGRDDVFDLSGGFDRAAFD